ncbi:hypothetical protein EVA_06679 [gut metagenome]|uniref:Uncharacterized protein n=1 Tax=gut metagenome TaxID=749906 RepID=J9CY89_9ZZZZ
MTFYGFRVCRPQCRDGSLRFPCGSPPVWGWVFTASVWVVPKCWG